MFEVKRFNDTLFPPQTETSYCGISTPPLSAAISLPSFISHDDTDYIAARWNPEFIPNHNTARDAGLKGGVFHADLFRSLLCAVT